MKRKNVITILVIAILVVVVIFGILQFKKEEAIPQNMVHPQELDLTNVNTSYLANLDVDVKRKEVTGQLFLTTINDTGKDQDAIYFHIYPNTFRDLSKLNDANWREILGPDPKPGWLDITNVKVNEKIVTYKVDDSILQIPLVSWKQNEKVNIEMTFSLKVPQDNATLSYDDHAIRFGNWLPTRAVYDENGWDLHPYYPIGDPFYSDVANYTINVTIPKDYQVASSGIDILDQSTLNGNKQTYSIKAQRMRDFAMVVMDGQYEPKISTIGGVTVRTWHYKSDAKASLNILHNVATSSIQFYGQHFGEYPYKEYDVVRTGGFFGGMEFPGLVYIQGTVFEGNYKPGVIYVAHETAHQWWYSVVGDNEVKNPWLDESLAQYSTLRYMSENYKDEYNGYYNSIKRQGDMAGDYEKNKEYVASPVTDFSSWRSYATLVYDKGPMMFKHLEDEVGSDQMDQVLQNIFNDYKFKNAQPNDYINEFKKVLGSNVEAYFNTWLHQGTTDFVAN